MVTGPVVEVDDRALTGGVDGTVDRKGFGGVVVTVGSTAIVTAGDRSSASSDWEKPVASTRRLPAGDGLWITTAASTPPISTTAAALANTETGPERGPTTMPLLSAARRRILSGPVVAQPIGAMGGRLRSIAGRGSLRRIGRRTWRLAVAGTASVAGTAVVAGAPVRGRRRAVDASRQA